MIKRNDVSLMNARTKNVAIAKETLDVIIKGGYVSPNGNNVDIAKYVAVSIEGTVLYQDDVATYGPALVPTIEIVNETTSAAARRLLANGKDDVVALNFASARNQGGGFIAGSIAQEEDLCRQSALYACLVSKPKYYSHNVACEDTYYTDDMIYSPNVPFFRDDKNALLDASDVFSVSIITAPAPNVSSMDRSEKDVNKLEETFRRRAAKVLRIAAKHGHKNIVLGAWGCGAFGNDPEMVANVFKDALKAFPAFEHVCFAVWDKRNPPKVFEAFERVLID